MNIEIYRKDRDDEHLITTFTSWRSLIRRLSCILLCTLTAHTHAADTEALCREAWNRVKQDYFLPVSENAFDAACPDSLDKVLNPHSRLIRITSEPGDRDYFGGIGLEMKLEGDIPKVVGVYEGFPAARAGVLRNDGIITINGISAKGLSLAEVAKRLRGPVNSTVALTLLRDGKTISISAIRRPILNPPTVITKEIAPGILWVRVTRFDTTTPREVVNQVLTHYGENSGTLTGIVFDFRGNPGGRFDAALALAAAFLPEDVPLIRFREQKAERMILSSDEEAFDHAQIKRLPLEIKSLPLVALINKDSAAGSEIVAGSWQGYGKAVVIGLPSLGKNTIETTWPMQSQPNTFLTLSTAVWSYPGGRSVAEHGLMPDVRSEDQNDTFEPDDASVILALNTLKELKRRVDKGTDTPSKTQRTPR